MTEQVNFLQRRVDILQEEVYILEEQAQRNETCLDRVLIYLVNISTENLHLTSLIDSLEEDIQYEMRAQQRENIE